jgi:polyhydroxybutyrate depolymerase
MMMAMRFASQALLILVLAGFAVAGEPKHGDFGSETIKIGGVTREYRLVAPRTVDLTKPAPLVIAFHGMLIDSKDVMPQYMRLNETAEKRQFIIAYPNAIGKSWGLAPEKARNDLALFDALLDKLNATYKIDPNRVYVVGMSNGGYFAHLVGRERSTIVAAVASHSGPLGLQTLFGLRAARKFPVLIIHGARDGLFPIAIARENRDKYKREGHETQYVELKNIGHMWGTNAGVNEIIWKFFADHPLEKKNEPSGRD